MSWLGKDLTDYDHGTVIEVQNGKRAVLTLPPGLLSAAKPEALLTLKADGTHRKVSLVMVRNRNDFPLSIERDLRSSNLVNM